MKNLVIAIAALAAVSVLSSDCFAQRSFVLPGRQRAFDAGLRVGQVQGIAAVTGQAAFVSGKRFRTQAFVAAPVSHFVAPVHVQAFAAPVCVQAFAAPVCSVPVQSFCAPQIQSFRVQSFRSSCGF